MQVIFSHADIHAPCNIIELINHLASAVNEDYRGMAADFVSLGFLAPGTDISPIVPALENIWADSKGQKMSDFNFRSVTSKFNELVYQVCDPCILLGLSRPQDPRIPLYPPYADVVYIILCSTPSASQPATAW